MTKRTMANELEGKNIEAVVFFQESGWREEGDPRWIPEAMRNRVLTFDEARPYLARQPDSCGYGGLDIWEFYAWSSTDVYYVHEYDGSGSLVSVPRHPGELT